MDLDWIIRAARGVGGLLCFRSLPVLCWALLANDIRVPSRIGLACACLISIGLAHHFGFFHVGWLAGVYAYYLGVAACVPVASRMVRDGLLTRGAVFAFSTGAFLLLPGLVLPASESATALIIGWDLVLSSYSYVIETSRMTTAGTLRECLFFLLVNPALVFTRRGQRIGEPKVNLHGCWRILVGMTVVFIAFAVALPADGALESRFESRAARALAAAGLAALLFLVEYARHSGLASVQIGMIRQLGFVVPERYDRPILAENPLDFWRRWNTYVGAWMLRYVFWPLSLTLGRQRGSLLARLAQPVALVATFATVGLMHDEQRYLRTLQSDLRGLLAFAATGLLVALYAGFGIAMDTVGWSAPKWLSSLARRSVLWTMTIALFAWWIG